MSAVLRMDARTLADLEVFPGETGAPGLASLLDRTRTPGGKRVLQEILRTPWADAGAIRAAQDALRFLQENVRSCRTTLDPAGIGLVERYLASRYACLGRFEGPGSSLGARWTALRYPELLAEARRGAEDVGRLAGEIVALCDLLLARGVPRGLAEVVGRLQATGHELLLVVGSALSSGAAPALLRADARLRGPLRTVAEAWLEDLYRLDALTGLAAAAQESAWVFPEIVESADGVRLSASALRHPLVAAPVANDVQFDAELPLMFLTGPNMAGKTTLMRAVGLAVYLAQLGMAVPAVGLRLAPFAGVISGIGAVDSTGSGCSHFLSEVRRLREAAEALATGQRVLLLFDEILRGTNVHDAREASGAVIESFAACANGATIVSSHVAELIPRLDRVPGVRLLHFDMSVAGGVPHYTYRLEPGAYEGRMATVLLHQEGLLEALERLAVGRGRA